MRVRWVVLVCLVCTGCPYPFGDRFPPSPHCISLNARCAEAMDRGNLSEATQYCDRALEYGPNSTSVLVNRGLIAQRLGNAAEAKAFYLRALRSYPGDEQADNNLGVLALQASDYPSAADYFQRALQRDPYYIAARYNLAVTLAKLKQSEEAKQELRTLTTQAPNLADPNYLLGQIAHDAGADDLAVNELNRATELSSSFWEAFELLGDVYMSKRETKLASAAYTHCAAAAGASRSCQTKLHSLTATSP